MHKSPYKHRFIAGSSKCSTKPLSILLTKLLTHIKQGLQKYCETAYSRSGVNQMWILKNSKELLDHLKSPNVNLVTNVTGLLQEINSKSVVRFDMIYSDQSMM